jgi:calcineurin-like phosphoesterase family protein
MKNWFTSDYHLSHQNVIKYDNRPFKYAVGEMDEHIIQLQNETVEKGDNFYFLGDFCFDRQKTEWYLSRLKGNLFFIKGNHDKKDTIKLYQRYGVYLGEQAKINVEDQDIVLNHFGMRVWDRHHYGSWHLYGHSHGSLPPIGKSLDVGCMLWDYYPIEFKQLKFLFETKQIHGIDHHKRN